MGPGGALHRSGVTNSRVNERTVVYTVGIPGAFNVNHTFTSAANALEQSLQLGLTTIIPANSPVVSVVIKCTEAIVGAAATTAICDVGNTSGGDEIISMVNMETLNQILSVSAQVTASSSASSIYFSITPGVNWNTLTAGKWKIWITYNDNSAN